jgi:hypothetical protein
MTFPRSHGNDASLPQTTLKNGIYGNRWQPTPSPRWQCCRGFVSSIMIDIAAPERGD